MAYYYSSRSPLALKIDELHKQALLSRPCRWRGLPNINECPIELKRAGKYFIIQEAAIEFGVTVDDILKDNRTHNAVLARHATYYLVRKLTGQSFPEIGRLNGGRDHTTVMHGCNRIESAEGKLIQRVNKVEEAASRYKKHTGYWGA